MKLVETSFGKTYQCKFDWPEDCFIQGNFGNGEKIKAFVEVFPKNPSTMIRSDASSIEEAEEKAWNKYQNYLVCELNHTNPENFDRRDYRNGVGFCKSCGMFQKIFEPLEICCKCGANTYYSQDNQDNWWCKECSPHMPEDLIPN